ncbi:uncharacterized protein LOC132926669 isoform X2 [Rhopalosiphum padi]|uniref:uncharacterized protein LOC132926040 n=1 Tax=Rhopalosiphum padi TaxID=40932 RepID=UPI00298E60CA|nr:uncharacterized protein LOC132926040 [Rhopalosiphum padi]XP_060847025.1 uncharacterized protein LOC132926662 isoform X2 [Rhopalosiphum padi]XP_060847029.1 uncharacterized protein LOC132926663 isoform X2 [Rhopalosiphum padi]XP_060847038.1 uncharacterized protein LOC132926667 isoform X2 [Rhopalosiphum padi]XP_060847042.1 uncharacterized protein LOC132926668 isoform X2 [Rhopalosiphum padi]XP_060847046.1 uncharacterized protein LOC132926669 isoform X2 [Rhopalosiphum padi]
MATYSVVHFFGDNSVAAVPRFWYSDKKSTCAWPKKPHNTKKLIEQCSIPNKIEYEYLEARVMSSGIESLAAAKQKAKKAMYISDLDEDEIKPKTKKLKTSIDCPVFSENYIAPENLSENSLHLPGSNIKKCETVVSQPFAASKQPLIDKSPVSISGWSPSPLKAAAKDHIKNASTDKISLKTIDSCTKKVISTTVSRKLEFGDYKDKPYNKKINFDMLSDEESFGTPIMKNKVSPFINKVTHNNEQTLKSNTNDRKKSCTPLQTIDSGSRICSNSAVDNGTQKILKSILKNMVYIQTDIKHLSMQQKEILSKLDSTSMLKNSIKCSSNNEFLDNFNWPINELEYLEVIEEKIKDQDMRDYLVNDLSHLGGNSIKAIIKRIVYKLFTDVLLSNFSFTGKKGKQKFCKLNLCSVIFDAVKNQTKVKNVDQNEMEERLKYHLAQAPFNVKRLNDKISESV